MTNLRERCFDAGFGGVGFLLGAGGTFGHWLGGGEERLWGELFCCREGCWDGVSRGLRFGSGRGIKGLWARIDSSWWLGRLFR